jgi:ketopantoate reductase
MANGIDNQQILPKYFSRIIYCIVSYNAWMDHPVIVGYQKKGPLVLGTPDNSLRTEMNAIADIFNQGVETVITEHLQDAVHSKIIGEPHQFSDDPGGSRIQRDIRLSTLSRGFFQIRCMKVSGL